MMFVDQMAARNERELHKYLTSDYNRNIIPSYNNSPVLVNIELTLTAIVSIDEVNELITTKSYLTVTWEDPRLSWQPIDFGNISEILLKQGQIWFPDIVVTNSIQEYNLIGFDELNVALSSDGEICWIPGITAQTICAIDTKFFPFDEQVCHIELVSWMSTNSYVIFKTDIPEQDWDIYENGQWELISMSSEVQLINTYSYFLFRFYLKRRATYYVTTIIVPVALISVLNCFTFAIPKQSGERISYSVTVFLAFVLIMTIVSAVLPKTSKQTSVLVIYIGCLLFTGLLTIITSIISIDIDYKKELKNENAEKSDNLNSNSCSLAATRKESKKSNNISATEEQNLRDLQGNETARQLRRENVTKSKGFLVASKLIKVVITYFETAAFVLVLISTVLSTFVTFTILVSK